MDKIRISYNSQEEMMSIECYREEVFYGNYSDLSRDPEELAKLLRKMGLDVHIDEDLPSIG